MQRTENQALLIWDHGVLMREKVIYWDCLQAKALPLFVREQLIRLHRVTGQCLYAGADAVLPCNATFNTKWEVRSRSRCPSPPSPFPSKARNTSMAYAIPSSRSTIGASQ